MRFADTPNILIRINPKSIAIGITDATMTLALTFPRKSISTTKTMSAPSMRLLITVEMLRLTSSERLR